MRWASALLAVLLLGDCRMYAAKLRDHDEDSGARADAFRESAKLRKVPAWLEKPPLTLRDSMQSARVVGYEAASAAPQDKHAAQTPFRPQLNTPEDEDGKESYGVMLRPPDPGLLVAESLGMSPAASEGWRGEIQWNEQVRMAWNAMLAHARGRAAYPPRLQQAER